MSLHRALEILSARQKVPRVPSPCNHGEPLEAAPIKEVPQVPQVHRKKTKTFCALSIKGQSEPPPATDLQSLAESIAAERGLTAEQCLSILDDDDKREIQHGDAGMILAWRTAVESPLFRGEWKPAPPPPEPVLVACADCKHATHVGPGLIDCAALVPSPAACGPYRRWATDRHLCEAWEAAA